VGPEAIQAVANGRVIQLGQPLAKNPTRSRGVPDFELELYEEHVPGKIIIPGQYEGVTSAADTIRMSTHSGTHMDSLGHIGYQGKLFDGTRIEDDGVQATRGGVHLKTREVLARSWPGESSTTSPPCSASSGCRRTTSSRRRNWSGRSSGPG
jgi:hypothetical protein